jgi:outer membrane receptor protein involved in Fe transport
MDYENAQKNILKHNILQLQLTIPVRAYYNIKVWKKLNVFFYAGPQLQIGLTNYDRIVDKNGYFLGSTFDENGQLINSPIAPDVVDWLKDNHLVPTVKDENGEDKIINQDQYVAHHLYRTNIQFGLGGGLEWDRYRLQAGYDFGLNNILRTSALAAQKINEWSWYVVFSYKL